VSSVQVIQGGTNSSIFFGCQFVKFFDVLYDVAPRRKLPKIVWHVSAIPLDDRCAHAILSEALLARIVRRICSSRRFDYPAVLPAAPRRVLRDQHVLIAETFASPLDRLARAVVHPKDAGLTYSSSVIDEIWRNWPALSPLTVPEPDHRPL